MCGGRIFQVLAARNLKCFWVEVMLHFTTLPMDTNIIMYPGSVIELALNGVLRTDPAVGAGNTHWSRLHKQIKTNVKNG